MNTMVQTKIVPSIAANEQAGWGQTMGQCARAAVALCLVTGLAYPLGTTVVAKFVFPHQAQGSLITKNGQVIGSSLIGQNFTGAGYFQGRPSVTTAPDPKDPAASIAVPYNAALAAASNQGVTSQTLNTAVAERVQAYRTLNGLGAQDRVPVDAVTASASGLDPHISVANARLQTERVAKARGLTEAQVSGLVDRHITPRDLWLLGEPRVNVLELNLALDGSDNKKKE
ncbi:K(+)-transporting ATPase subunit C [Diaphorobacter sp. HDW4A]|uniref:K(+)-transporting ATPase subunit C n=1 Tax=Diaphorobacter sp. HDW4A TaxID=2714924 RepID=UPI0014095DA1|nr:K(+)-transporting ATPase subunit C [Diaphorobacter sp. HDW4A]